MLLNQFTLFPLASSGPPPPPVSGRLRRVVDESMLEVFFLLVAVLSLKVEKFNKRKLEIGPMVSLVVERFKILKIIFQRIFSKLPSHPP